MHHLARHSVACFLTRGDLVHDLILLANHFFCIIYLFFLSLTLIIFADSLFIGKKGVMFLRGLIRIGQSTMETGFGFHVHHSFTRYEALPESSCL